MLTVVVIGVAAAVLLTLIAIAYADRRTTLGQQQYDPGLAALKRLVADNPRNADMRVKLSLFLSRQRRFREAVDALDSAIEIAPTRSDARYHRALAYIQLGRRADAEEDLRWIRANSDSVYYKTAANGLIRRD